MHESGVARTIVAALRDHGPWDYARILITDPSFAHSVEALRLHVQVEGPDLDLARLEIVNVAVPAVCMTCGADVAVFAAADPCPRCDGSVLTIASSPTITLELDRRAGTES